MNMLKDLASDINELFKNNMWILIYEQEVVFYKRI